MSHIEVKHIYPVPNLMLPRTALRLELYLMENFRHAFDMESYVYYTQVMQAETLAAAYR